MILASIGLILFAIFYSLGMYISNENNKPSDDGHTYENNSQIPNSLHKMIYRDRWGGRKPLYERPQKTPVKYVIISHTVGTFCESIHDCSLQMVQMQSQHVSELESPDIGYNFVIGGDDNIYVGRGWDNHNFHMNLDTIGISFIGNYVYNTLKPGMIEATHELLKLGVEKGKLDKDYILVGHNQTDNTISPGPNIYRQIKFWPHFSPEILIDTQK